MNEPFFDYELPPDRIAQFPADRRDASRLLRVTRFQLGLSHHHFYDLPNLLRPNDLLVLNDTRVLPARLIGKRDQTGGAWEGLYLRQTDAGLWEMLAQTRGYAQPGESFTIHPPEDAPSPESPLRLILVDRTEDRHWLMRPEPEQSPETLLIAHGRIPLPPYIRKGRSQASDLERYQTVYANLAGSVAAPTAGLHFTPELFTRLEAMGVARARITLHVGIGTFQPMKTNDPTQHVMHHEWGMVPESTVAAIDRCRSAGGRVIAVGTTVTRALESAAKSGTLQPWQGETNLFIHPPYPFRVLDGLITNFHLPKSTLLLLVDAFAGSDTIAHAYNTAITEGYRFFSYGDAMLLLNAAAN
ncbi:tRNA preQ1(34) S-adenosylmethionine ribosyltransferase-isomerase QueA [Tuwongella immobilis]|uniref:S-adenosylmethionine:tRNA ribosyltransferase-isomerase n=1 Tax=Tuwongella immobilis TaxID=692036 RepID=A0A6C2YSV7_9BACT|nr:tRNA preQ1(34) S-adenosylmethionine ribosyltransferase-isomerase QueA [Tuwongella immobilis]VIP04025.1 s-adenosylmethionine:trna ribosyltransferase-isomerase : S-adenosylmethionine:tRNA ribosyltransferase-isomerase OS=Planctomyces brasiliensis (strain ATCC 49424 / DSM 5305 / JCM 21570 / NBRC 103401 / IFAM 1448) GN=queA PE=3 SV=1: Queuosine_synth [Tuwongella immobilis]VTS05417.1 s-adenosylmethionine:trna ribosyltransferase-isomerase : S-adenosylmethionine:tRNA ribosyltransferase-isomerase OS=Pl